MSDLRAQLREQEERRRKEEEKRKQEIKRNTGQTGTAILSASELEWSEADYIGGGSSGKVFKGKCRGNVVAVKIMYDRNGSLGKVWRSFLAELDVLSKMRHVNICTFLGACEKNGKFAIVSELLSSDLRSFLNEHGPQLSYVVKLKLMHDAALGMSWLYGREQKIIHRDLKLENILIDVDKMIVKVCDFGLADYAIKEETDPDNPLHGDTGKGNALYKAPELLQEKEYTEKIDVYAYGLALWEVLTGGTAYKKYDDMYKAGVPNAWHSFVNAVCTGERPPLDAVRKVSKELATLIDRCWAPDPAVRPSFQDVIHEMCSIILNLAIRNKTGQKIWARFCMQGKGTTQLEEIKMSVSIDALLQEILVESGAELPENEDIAEDQLRATEKLLKHFPKENFPFAENAVQITQFGAFLDAIGGLTPDVFKRVRSLVHTPGFYGQVESTKLKTSLAIAGAGSYILRFSSNPGSITLSYVPVNSTDADPATVTIEHRRIDFDGKLYKFSDGTEQSDNLGSLLAVPRIRALCFKPCLGSPFAEDDSTVLSKYV